MSHYMFGDANGNMTAGRVALLDVGDGDALPRYIEIANLADAEHPPERTGIIVTGGTGALQAAAQTRSSLGGSLYSYGFGRRPGAMTITGLAYSELCDSTNTEISTLSASNAAARPAGLRTLVEFFNRYNQGVYEKPLQVTLQPTLVKDAFLLGLNWNYSNAGLRLIEFSLNWTLLP